MKNIFGIRKEKGFDYDINGNQFKVNQISQELENKLNETSNWMQTLNKNAKLPSGLNFLKTFGFIVFLVIGFSLFRAETTLEESYQNAPYIFFIGAIAILLFLGLWLYEKARKKAALKEETVEEMKQKVDQVLKETTDYLDIPSDAISIDVFAYTYKLNDEGNEVINTSKMFHYMNQPLYFYIKNDMLYFADHFNVYAVSLDSITSIETIDKKATVYGWNKEIPFNQEPYKSYKIRANQFNVFFIKPYYQVLIEDMTGDYYFYIPHYELEALNALIQKPVH
jgi:hypothetical protein